MTIYIDDFVTKIYHEIFYIECATNLKLIFRGNSILYIFLNIKKNFFK